MSDSTYPGLTQAEQVVKTLVWNPLIVAGETDLEGLAPLLAIPVVKEIEEGAINDLMDGIYSALCQWIDIELLPLKNKALASAVTVATLKLKVIAAESGINSSAFQTARDAEVQNLIALCRINSA